MNETSLFSHHPEQEGSKMRREEDESLIIYLKKELEAAFIRNDSLDKENEELRQEMARLKSQVISLKAHDNERRSMLWKKIQNPNDSCKTEVLFQQKPSDSVKVSEQSSQELAARKERPEKVPIPPPPRFNPTVQFPLREVNKDKLTPKPMSTPAPPPPPRLPSKIFMGSKSIRRVPEVIEFYRLLTRKNAQMDSRTNPTTIPAVASTVNMIGEIENRSTYLSTIKSDVEKQKGFINFLIKEIETAAFKDIADVEAFVKWLDNELSSLTDERAVLKHFPEWPERKADSLREAAFNFRDLKKLESEILSFETSPKEPLKQALGKLQAMQERLERSVNNTERTRESTVKRYKDFQIPCEWLLDTGFIGQLKLSSLQLAREHMKRISKELMQLSGCSEEGNLLLQGARFAYRVHQFAGGFDAEAIRAFQELKKLV